MSDEKKEKVDEKGAVIVDEHIKIFDPNTEEVYIDKREDTGC